MLPNQEKAFWEFYNTARKNKVLDEKTTLMIYLAAAMAVGCYPCMRHYKLQKKLVGLSDEEEQVVESIVMAVSAGRVMMQHQEASGKAQAGGQEDCDKPC
jgi:alkylhydroperoxidase/carboxymuconolactone decarboxylase family protein YurZ